MMPPIKFLLKRICELEEVVWKNPRRLFSACQSFVSERNERSIFESLFGLTHPINFPLMTTYGLEEDAVWRLSRLLLSSWSTWYLNKMSLFILSPHVAGFLLKNKYGFQEEIVLKIPRWLFYAWPSLIFEWINLSNNSVSPFLVSLRSNRCFGNKDIV